MTDAPSRARVGGSGTTFWNIVVLLGLLTTLPVSAVLPANWGWENGPLENAQALMLFAGAVTAMWAAVRQTEASTRALWWTAALVWLVMAGRELAWGAAFLAPRGFDDHGPIVSSSVLWYRPAVPWICAALLLIGLTAMWRSSAWSRVVARLHRERAWPWFRWLLLVVAMLMSAVAEEHTKQHLPFPYVPASTPIAEELFETWGYLALWLAQWQVMAHMRRWRTH
ncbi:hypothetical protein [Diaphorobacter aerolatus]|uniref:Uncharacterized protein n=1 Tax=Diaphorobacter aerolatus TaxID=1288495 RepID=A0A7H0GG05_9BURK|nr:hypothetical protein [Diaphorobacter aerolatus]QNP47221.1 hypothetical protein H9K75_12570 [Diaphorobacter aerolatus]